MIKDVFKLKSDSWHANLMNWVWGYRYYEFRNMCPYFWLSVFNVVFIWAILLAKGFKRLIIFIGEQVEQYDQRCREQEAIWLQQMLGKVREDLKSEKTDSLFLQKLFWAERKYSKFTEKYRKLFYELDWEERQELIKLVKPKVQAIEDKKYEQKRVKERTRAQKIGKATVIIKKVAKVLGVVLAIVVVYLLYLFGKWAATWNWPKIGAWVVAIVGIILIIIVACFILYLIGQAIKYLWCRFGKYCVPCEENRKSIGNGFVSFFKAIAMPFVWFGKGVVLLWEVLVALKQDNCPAIEWDKEAPPAPQVDYDGGDIEM